MSQHLIWKCDIRRAEVITLPGEKSMRGGILPPRWIEIGWLTPPVESWAARVDDPEVHALARMRRENGEVLSGAEAREILNAEMRKEKGGE